MGVYTTTRLYCNECTYEEPNDYYFGVKKWVEVTDLETEEKYHFCSQKCLEQYAKNSPEIIFVDTKEIDSVTQYLNNYEE